MAERMRGIQRTEAFFSQDSQSIQPQFLQRTIGMAGDDRLAVVTQARAYTREQNKGVYLPVTNKRPGQLWICDFKFRKTLLPLVATPDGSCVELKSAARFDPATGQQIPFKLERDFAVYFGLEPDETTWLRFLNDSERLYIVRDPNIIVPERNPGRINPESEEDPLGDLGRTFGISTD